MFDSIINSAEEKFGLGDKAGSLLSSLLALIASSANGSFSGFIAKFRDAGLGDLVDSWITTGDNTPISNEQLKSALGEKTINSVAEQNGVEKETATSAMAYMMPQVIDVLTPDGEIPDHEGLLSKTGGFLGGIGGAAGAMASGTVDRVDAAAAMVGERIGGGLNTVGDAFEDDGDDDGILKWLIPLLLVGFLIVIGAWFCGKSVPPATPNTNSANLSNTSGNTAINTNSSATNMNANK